MATDPRIDCRKCRHFYVTWEAAFPNGCGLFGFKAKTMPSLTVWEATGKPCENFEEKPRKKTANKP